MTLSNIYADCKVDWTNFYLSIDGCQNDSSVEFDIMPEEFLKFAKYSLTSVSRQTRIDAMGNAKRAIEAQIDLLISTLGYDYKIFDNRNSYPNTKKYINNKYSGEHCEGIIPRIKLLNILGLAPTIIISEIRYLRNKMEHEYIVPLIDEVKKAVEVAELFINSSNRKLSSSLTDINISNEVIKIESENNRLAIKYPIIEISYDTYYCRDKLNIKCCKTNTEMIEVNLEVDDEKYIDIIEILFKEDFKLLPFIFGYEIPSSKIKYTQL